MDALELERVEEALDGGVVEAFGPAFGPVAGWALTLALMDGVIPAAARAFRYGSQA